MISNPEPDKYPIGKFSPPDTNHFNGIDFQIKIIELFPGNLRSKTENLNEVQLNTPYRTGGWTVKQLIHHVADSHINAYCRIKLAITEENPVIKPYEQDLWAQTPEINIAPISVSLDILTSVHERWVILMRSLDKEYWNKTFFHPESGAATSLYEFLYHYAWHCEHHFAHINQLGIRKGW